MTRVTTGAAGEMWDPRLGRYVPTDFYSTKLPKGSTRAVTTIKDRSHLNPFKWGKGKG